MPKPIAEQVVVITGASSGIGRATAKHLAARGARVVVTARRAEALDTLVEEIAAEGGEALAVPGDVTREEDLRAVARAAVARFGRIDTWVNNAGVVIQGRVQDVPLDEVRRQLDVNLVGMINGTRCALDVMLPRGEGTVVQVSSIAAKQGAPYLSAYSAAKAGVGAFTEAVRTELRGRGVALSVLYVPPVDTPIDAHSRGRLGVQPKPTPPVAYPEEVARGIERLAASGDREGYVFWARAFVLMSTAFPGFTEGLLHHVRRGNWSDEAPGEDNVDSPSATTPPEERAGAGAPGWRGLTLREALRMLPAETLLASAALGALVGAATRR